MYGEGQKSPVRSVEISFDVLKALMELDGAGVSELASFLDVPKSTLHNHLSTLEQQELLVKDGTTYRVGIPFLALGAYARNQYPLYDIAREEVDHLAEVTGELANLLIEEDGWGYYLYRAHGANAVSIDAHVGTRVPLHSTALGKAILAHLPDDRVRGIAERRGLAAATEQTTTDLETLRTELATVREQGYAVDDEEHRQSLRCVTVPVLNGAGRPLGAISVAGPSNRVTGDRFEAELPKHLEEQAKVIELNVTFS